MVRPTSVYICQQCGFKSSQYLGKCPQCDSWNSMVETIEQELRSKNHELRGKTEIIDLSKIQKTDYKRLDTGFGEFNRVLGGGVVAGSLVLVAGDPGIGKSTLLTQLALNINSDDRRLKVEGSNLIIEDGKIENRIYTPSSTIKKPSSILYHLPSNVLYVAGEESAQQIKIRVDRIKPNAPLSVLNETDVDLIVEAISLNKQSLVIVDSIQTLQTQDLESVAGSVGQVRECANRLQRLAKFLHIPIFLVGHVTKEGSVAGPKTLEHVVDVVLSLEGDPNNMFRILRATKNRFGPTDEVGVFEMEEAGMIEVKNPSRLFLEEKVNAPGSTVVPILTGLRPILVEIQALVTKTSLPQPRRTGSGIDNNRLQLLVALLQKRLKLPLFDQDVFVNVTGGIRVFEPAADLAICMAIISSFKETTIKEKTAFIGEVGLLGEVRMVREIDKRMTEASKLGYVNVISPKNARSLSQAVKLTLT